MAWVDYSGGEIASTYAVDEIKEYLASLETVGQQDLCDAIIHANQRIVNRVACEERLLLVWGLPL